MQLHLFRLEMQRYMYKKRKKKKKAGSFKYQ